MWTQVISLAAVGLVVAADATAEAQSTCEMGSRLLNELFPAVLAALRHPDEGAAMAVLPFLHAYVAKLKTSLKRSGALTLGQVGGWGLGGD